MYTRSLKIVIDLPCGWYHITHIEDEDDIEPFTTVLNDLKKRWKKEYKASDRKIAT